MWLVIHSYSTKHLSAFAVVQPEKRLAKGSRYAISGGQPAARSEVSVTAFKADSKL